MDAEQRAILEFLLGHEDATIRYGPRSIGAVRELIVQRAPGTPAADEAASVRLIAKIDALDALARRGLVGADWSDDTVWITDLGRSALEQAREA